MPWPSIVLKIISFLLQTYLYAKRQQRKSGIGLLIFDKKLLHWPTEHSGQSMTLNSYHHDLWMGENHFALAPSALYGVVLLMAAIAYWILQQLVIALQGPDSLLKNAAGGDWKSKLSPILYLILIATAFCLQWASQGIFVLVAMIWLVPYRHTEKVLGDKEA